ncbi:DNA repair protein RAD51 homolog 4 isoform X2 [Venturia canescens]|nr:DNA repair protein RAD51 homolog 4 isoform X2 [Venturia canescens]XP_043282969.1 DNA repair protein RAD51 homolog 4 isoform X2 [Venturia canescens]XP_043282970.1 DNA repair protein RAD51 homolog 4 isoform X2 [Venturia canescens]
MARLHKQIHDALNDEALRRLKIINVNTVIEFLEQDDNKLEQVVKIEHRIVQQIKRNIIKNYAGKIENGEDLLRLENNFVSTGIASLDDLLNGGLYPGELYELCGLSSAGKTQLCHSIAINVILETDGMVRYIDTKKDFSGSRIQMMLEAKKIGDEETARVMNQIKVIQVKNVNELFGVLYDMAKSEEKWANEKSTKLVIIDSLPSLILSTLGKNTNSHRSLNQMAGVLRFLANEHQISVITNNLVSKWQDIERFGAPIPVKPIRVKPYLGKYWEHAPNTRLHIEKMYNGEKRKISVWKSFELKIGTSCIAELTDAGFT